VHPEIKIQKPKSRNQNYLGLTWQFCRGRRVGRTTAVNVAWLRGELALFFGPITPPPFTRAGTRAAHPRPVTELAPAPVDHGPAHPSRPPPTEPRQKQLRVIAAAAYLRARKKIRVHTARRPYTHCEPWGRCSVTHRCHCIVLRGGCRLRVSSESTPLAAFRDTDSGPDDWQR